MPCRALHIRNSLALFVLAVVVPGAIGQTATEPVKSPVFDVASTSMKVEAATVRTLSVVPLD